MSVQTSNVNDRFFEGSYKEVWRKLIQPGLSEAECDFVQEVAGLKSGDAVLDIMCGYGRHAIELAKRGFSVTAIDNSKTYIAEIAAKSAEQDLKIEAVAIGALEAELHKSYKAILCMGNSFAFFNSNDGTQLLKKLSDHLQPEGVLIINSWVLAEIAIRHFRKKDWIEVDGYKYLMNNEFLFHPSRIESEHTIISGDGDIEVIKGIDYIFSLGELEAMFQQAGLTTKGVFSNPRKKPFKIGDGQVYIVAGK